ncbi:MAG TPA: DUF1003 domain-containing protein [Terriglobia bacterium]|nr:DUF1003 domain-containing protein [Terriglobia bacterium]
MQAIVWLISGLLAGWLARIVMKRKKSGFLSDVTLGILGGVIGAWMLGSLGGKVPVAGSAAHVAVAVVGAMVLVGAGRLLERATYHAGLTTSSGSVPGVPELEAYVKRLGAVERRVFSALVKRQPVSTAPSETDLTFGQRVADGVAEFGGSWTFLSLFAAFLLGWILLNTKEGPEWDPYPFILLNLLLSCLAAIQAPVIMMSQNRQASKDRQAAQRDYEVNLKSEMEVMSLHTKLDEAREIEWKSLLEMQQTQMAILDRLETRLADLEKRA